jgi:phosphinothricin acetyltransferase
VAAIYNHAIEERVATFETEPRSEIGMRQWIAGHDARHPILVAVAPQDAVVGWASVSEYRPRSCYAGVGEFSVYVAHDQRGRGVGKVLLTGLVEEAGRLGYWKLVSRIFPFNVASRELCKRCGFREVGVYEKHGKLDGKWIDTVIVERLVPENLV